MKKKHLREIERINRSIPKELTDKLMVKRPLTSTAKEMMLRALANPEEVKGIVSKSELRRFRVLIDSGKMDQTEEVIDTEVEKQINDYLDKEFEKARKLGRLPPPQAWPKLKNKSKELYVQQKKEGN